MCSPRVSHTPTWLTYHLYYPPGPCKYFSFFCLFAFIFGILVFELHIQRKRPPWASAELCSVHQPAFCTQCQGRAARCKCSLNHHTFSYLIIPPIAFSYIWCFPCMEHFCLFLQGSFYIYLHIEDWCESGGCVVGGRLVPDCFVLITTHIDFQPTSF